MLKIHWEFKQNIWNTKTPKNSKTMLPSPKEKRLDLLGACCITSLAQQKFIPNYVPHHF
jgi:hypothetical protein